MKIFLVNLDRDLVRLERMQGQLKNLGLEYERISAVDGRSADFAPRQLGRVDPAFLEAEGPSTAGCALSHFDIYEKIRDSQDSKFLVLEDDLELSSNLPKLLESIESCASWPDPSVCLLHSIIIPEECKKHDKLHFSTDQVFDSCYHLCSVAPGVRIFSTGAYIITKTAALNLLEKAFPVRAVADNWSLFERLGCFAGLKLIFPHPVDSGIEFSSRDPRGGLLNKVKKSLLEANIPVISQLYRKRLKENLSEHFRKRNHCFIDDQPLKTVFL